MAHLSTLARRTAALLLLGAAFTAVHAQPADLIVTNAKIATLDASGTMAQALAVRDGKIAAVGSAASMRALQGAGTRIVDARGHTVIPGLIDSHMHAVRAA
ncbi:MAG: amidohydrolase, partial [Variovorax sp.]